MSKITIIADQIFTVKIQKKALYESYKKLIQDLTIELEHNLQINKKYDTLSLDEKKQIWKDFWTSDKTMKQVEKKIKEEEQIEKQ